MKRILAILLSVVILSSSIAGCNSGTDQKAHESSARDANSSNVHTNPDTSKESTAELKTKSVTLSPEMTGSTLENGITVDVGDFILDSDTELTVSPQKTEENKDEGYKVESYDFSLGDLKKLDDFITIKIPYDSSFCEPGQDPSRCVGAKYKNEETGAWEDVLFEVDAKNQELVIYTDHLSVYGAFYVDNEGKRNAYITDVLDPGRYIDDATTIELSQKITEDEPSVMKTLMHQGAELTGMFYDCADELDNAINISTLGDVPSWLSTDIPETNQSLFSMLGYINTCINLMNISLKESVGHGADKKEILNLIRDVGSKVTTYWAKEFTSFGTEAISVGMGGVLIIDKMLTAFAEEAKATKLEDIAYVYHHYNEGYYSKNHKPMTPKDWRAKVIEIVDKHPDDPEVAIYALEAGFTKYASEFFTLTADEMYDVAADTPNVNVKNIPNFTEAEKNQLIDEYIAYLKEKTMPAVLTSVRNYMIKKLEQKQLDAINKVREYYNSKITINIKEEFDEAVGSIYKGYKFRLSPLSDKANANDWTGIWPEKGSVHTSATLLGITLAGYPHTVEFFRPDADMTSDEPELIVPYTISMPEINISFGGAEPLSIDAFMGEWMDDEGCRTLLIRNGDHVICKEPDLSWHSGKISCTEYSAEVDMKSQTLMLQGITSWLSSPDTLYDELGSENRELEIDASSSGMDYTAITVSDGIVTEMTNGVLNFTRNN